MATILLYAMGEKTFIVDTPLLSLKENFFHQLNIFFSCHQFSRIFKNLAKMTSIHMKM